MNRVEQRLLANTFTDESQITAETAQSRPAQVGGEKKKKGEEKVHEPETGRM